jgi:hypothetical protein
MGSTLEKRSCRSRTATCVITRDRGLSVDETRTRTEQNCRLFADTPNVWTAAGPAECMSHGTLRGRRIFNSRALRGRCLDFCKDVSSATSRTLAGESAGHCPDAAKALLGCCSMVGRCLWTTTRSADRCHSALRFLLLRFTERNLSHALTVTIFDVQ